MWGARMCLQARRVPEKLLAVADGLCFAPGLGRMVYSSIGLAGRRILKHSRLQTNV